MYLVGYEYRQAGLQDRDINKARADIGSRGCLVLNDQGHGHTWTWGDYGVLREYARGVGARGDVGK